MPANKKYYQRKPVTPGKWESLLYRGKIEAKRKSVRLERVEPAWKAGTLPTELLPLYVKFTPASIPRVGRS